MKNNCFFFLLLFLSLRLTAQENTEFSTQDLRIAVPTFLPGVMQDPDGLLQNDSLVYNLKGILYRKGFRISQGSRSLSLSTPVDVIKEMVDAYAKKDKNRIINLFNSSSEAQVRNLINGPEGNEYLTYVRSTAIQPLELLAAIQYGNGYLMFIKDKETKVHVNYVVKEGSEYKLSALTDKKPTSWNLNVYFNAAPLPMVPLKSVIRKDSIALNDSVLVQTVIPEGMTYVALFTDKPGEAPRLLVADNGKDDLNLTKNRVSFYVPGYLFLQPDIYKFYIAAFNFPITFVSQNFFSKEGEYYIKIIQ